MSQNRHDSVAAEPATAPLATDLEPLLNADEEYRLGLLIMAGRAAEDELAQAGPVEVECLEWVRQEGRYARNRLIQRNLRLVYHEVSRFRGRGLDLADLIQEGAIGLLQAAERFDPSRGFRFSTYAVPWVRQAVERAAQNQPHTVRIPRRVIQHRDPTEARPDLLPPASLDEQIADSSDHTLADHLADPDANPAEAAIHAVLVEGLWEALQRAPEREREVLIRRYGLSGHLPETHESIAASLGVCRERVRQIELTALRRLRANDRLAQ